MLAWIKHPPGLGRVVLPLVCGFIFGSCSSLFLFRRAVQHSPTPYRHLGQEDGAGIPPIVHFVQLKEERASRLHFSFEAFLALYAAYANVHPATIYIHHDFSHEEIADAVRRGTLWTRQVLTAFPCLRLNSVTAPTEANGYNITRVEHRSDFVRLEQLRRHGGIYLDWDVVTLRPLESLRRAGFQAVVGRQFDAFINNGILLATPQSAAMRIFADEAQRVFDGGWITHSVKLLTRVADRLAAAAGEVLIMDHKAFAPFSWEQASVDALLRRHTGEAVPEPTPASVTDPGQTSADELWATRSAVTDQHAWIYDFSDALFLHKIFNSVDSPPGYTGVNVPYILARDSNYALATWPLVMKGIKDRLIDPRDDTY
ncbi:hypothetical protein LZ32DRAFT_652339 [Colletotrichum eremochloae]|nr:hypothetical protein LZ32DRAFT_652339 [Colletotrichum eremochloae]